MSKKEIKEIIPGYTLAADAAKYLAKAGKPALDASRIRRLAIDGRLKSAWLDEQQKKIRIIEIDSLLNYEKERDAFDRLREAQSAAKKAKQQLKQQTR